MSSRSDQSNVIEIVFLLGSQKGRVFFLKNPGIFTIGRDPTCEIHILENDVSRFHARLIWDGHVLTIEDLRSKNGVFLNGSRIVCYKLDTDDIVGIGSCTFQISKNECSAVEIDARESLYSFDNLIYS
jgi:pSer/pThr/pTyr-binding forkhead associated (FHA) protein